MSPEKQIDKVIQESLYTAKPRLVLSQAPVLALATQRLMRAWETQPARNQPRVGALISENIALPWSEKPAHILYWHLMETLDFEALHMLLLNASHISDIQMSRTNALIAEVLERIRFPPGIFGRSRLDHEETRALLKAYLYDSCTPAVVFRVYCAKTRRFRPLFAAYCAEPDTFNEPLASASGADAAALSRLAKYSSTSRWMKL